MNDCLHCIRISPSVRIVAKWGAEFKCSLEDNAGDRSLRSASTPELIAKTQDMVLKERRLSVRDLVEALEISLVGVSDILAVILGFRKLCVQWVPHLIVE